MQTPKKIRIRTYLRRRFPKTPERVVKGALGELRRQHATQNLRHVCHLQVSDEDSQVIAAPEIGFRRGGCTIVNLGNRRPFNDVEDEVEAAVTIYHEALHARDIARQGEGGISRENEIRAHEETIEFLKDWQKREKRENVQRRLAEEIREEQQSIETLRRER